jgi:hypothetical protein
VCVFLSGDALPPEPMVLFGSQADDESEDDEEEAEDGSSE